MGQKVNPNGLRLGINKTWESRWYSKKDYAKNLHEDVAIRRYLRGRLRAGEVSKLEIIRYPDKVNVIVHTARPGIVIGRKGAEVEVISKELQKFTDKNIQIKIKEIKTPELDATLLALSIARQLEGRVAFRRAPGGSRSPARGGSGEPRCPATRATRMGWCRCTPSGPTSNTATPPPSRPSARSGSRCGCTRATSSRRKEGRTRGF
jgi:KH domain